MTAEIVPFPRNPLFVMPDLAPPSVRAKRSNFASHGKTASSDKAGKMKFEIHAFDLTGDEAMQFSLLWMKLRGIS
jgi:hypothetical protein